MNIRYTHLYMVVVRKTKPLLITVHLYAKNLHFHLVAEPTQDTANFTAVKIDTF